MGRLRAVVVGDYWVYMVFLCSFLSGCLVRTIHIKRHRRRWFKVQRSNIREGWEKYEVFVGYMRTRDAWLILDTFFEESGTSYRSTMDARREQARKEISKEDDRLCWTVV